MVFTNCWVDDEALCVISWYLVQTELQSLPLFQEALSTQTVDDYFAKNPALREKIDDEIRNHIWGPKVSTTVSWLCTIKATFIYHLLWLTKGRKTYSVPHMHIHRNDAKVASSLLIVFPHCLSHNRRIQDAVNRIVIRNYLVLQHPPQWTAQLLTKTCTNFKRNDIRQNTGNN